MAWTNFDPYRRESKNHARKAEVDGIQFNSVKEANRYREPCFLQKAGEISGLERQEKYVLIPRQLGKDGKVAERECAYVADFCYRDRSGKLVVEDTKGYRTRDYIIKRKLMLYVHGVRITEV